MQEFVFTIEEAIAKLKVEDKLSVQLFTHGTMQLKYSVSKKIDTQTPHKQDEIYVISSGTSAFTKNGEKIFCKTGDAIFVEAGAEHRFEDMSEDFATWVIFYGPDGGEK